MSLYNALQVKVDRHFSQGFQFGLSYTWSKLITNAAEDLFGRSPIENVVQNPFDIRSLRSVSPNNSPHVVVFNYLYELPFGKGKALLSSPGVLNKIVGGWQISGIQRYQAGLPTLVLDSGGAYAGDLENLAGYYSSVRPNLTGQPILTGNNASGISFQVVNPAAFSLPPLFNNAAVTGTDVTAPQYQAYYANPKVFFGTAPPVLAGARTLPFYSEQLSLLKKTPLTERLTLEFRSEFFNPFNRHRYFQPLIDLNDPGNFGKATVINDANNYGPRTIQLGLKLIF